MPEIVGVLLLIGAAVLVRWGNWTKLRRSRLSEPPLSAEAYAQEKADALLYARFLALAHMLLGLLFGLEFFYLEYMSYTRGQDMRIPISFWVILALAGVEAKAAWSLRQEGTVYARTLAGELVVLSTLSLLIFGSLVIGARMPG